MWEKKNFVQKTLKTESKYFFSFFHLFVWIDKYEFVALELVLKTPICIREQKKKSTNILSITKKRKKTQKNYHNSTHIHINICHQFIFFFLLFISLPYFLSQTFCDFRPFRDNSVLALHQFCMISSSDLCNIIFFFLISFSLFFSSLIRIIIRINENHFRVKSE